MARDSVDHLEPIGLFHHVGAVAALLLVGTEGIIGPIQNLHSGYFQTVAVPLAQLLQRNNTVEKTACTETLDGDTCSGDSKAVAFLLAFDIFGLVSQCQGYGDAVGSQVVFAKLGGKISLHSLNSGLNGTFFRLGEGKGDLAAGHQLQTGTLQGSDFLRDGVNLFANIFDGIHTVFLLYLLWFKASIPCLKANIFKNLGILFRNLVIILAA